MNTSKAFATLLACIALAACGGGGGGGGGGGTVAGSGVPASAISSTGGLIAYMQQLIAGTSETGDPVSLGDVTLPVDDTAEPAAI